MISLIESTKKQKPLLRSQGLYWIAKRLEGIEPSSEAWKAAVLPLHHSRTQAVSAAEVPNFIQSIPRELLTHLGIVALQFWAMPSRTSILHPNDRPRPFVSTTPARSRDSQHCRGASRSGSRCCSSCREVGNLVHSVFNFAKYLSGFSRSSCSQPAQQR